VQQMPETDWKAIATLLVAGYGAVLATAVAVHNALLVWRARRPSVKVKVWLGPYEYPTGPSGEDVVIVQASNPGQKAVTLRSMGIVLPDSSRIYYHDFEADVAFPHQLGPESSCLAAKGASMLALRLEKRGLQGKVNIKGFYVDAIGRTYLSKRYELDMDRIDDGFWKDPSWIGRH
jgi:hypothetical protein